jgi:voltage-gated potassium channel
MKTEDQNRRHQPYSYFKRLPRTGKSLGRRLLTLLGLPLFVLITLFVHGGTLFFAWIFYLLEFGTNPKLVTFLDAVFWSVTTVTTVGYGDIVPITDYGKVLGIVTMIFGTLCIVIYTAFFAGALIAPELSFVEAKVKAMEAGVKEIEREVRSDDEIQKEILRHIEQLVQRMASRRD